MRGEGGAARGEERGGGKRGGGGVEEGGGGGVTWQCVVEHEFTGAAALRQVGE